MKNISFIVNADDLGESSKINCAIKDYAEKNLISSATMLANGKEFEGAKLVANDCKHISIGAHLNLTEFESLSKSDILFEHGITDALGVFTGIMKYSNRENIKLTSQLIDAMCYEWELQLIKLFDNGIAISHIDGHNHVHYNNALFFIIKRLQKKFGIKKVRIKNIKPLRFYGLYNKTFKRKTPPLLNEFNNAAWNSLIKYYAPLTITSDYIFSYYSLYNYLKVGCQMPKSGIFEIITHPGSNYLEYFQEENLLIENNTLQKLIPSFSMITYNDL